MGVIGVGSMGGNHARVYKEMADLVAVCDFDEKKAKEVANRFGCDAYSDVDEFLKKAKLDAVTVATPTVYHKEPVVKAFESGVDVLVEKPIADTVENARDMIKAAEKHSRVFSVGMIERHNPIVNFTKEVLEKNAIGKLVTISTRRVSNYPARIKDVGVVTDLGVHDIDVIRYLANSEIKSVYALGGNVKTYELMDHAIVLLQFQNGIEGVMEVSWLTPMKLRQVMVTGIDGFAEMDYVDQELKISHSSYGNIDVGNLWKIPQNYDIKRMRVAQEEPLKREIKDFLDSIEKGRDPLVKGVDGLRDLEIAKAAERSILEEKKIIME